MTAPEDYTWEVAARDLALLTHLTHLEAIHLVQPLRDIAGLVPYDATYWLQELLVAKSAEEQGRALYALLMRTGGSPT